MKTQHFAALLGLALTVTGAVFMFTHVHRSGVDCGAAFAAKAFAGADCDGARATRETLTLAFGTPGLVLLLGGGIAVLSARGEFTRPPSYRDVE